MWAQTQQFKSDPPRRPGRSLAVWLYAVVVLLPAMLTIGCAGKLDKSGMEVTPWHDAIIDCQKQQIIAPKELFTDHPAFGEYRVGPNDVLFVNVSNRIEFSSPGYDQNSAIGTRVDGTGCIQLPMIGQVYVMGMTLSEIQNLISMEFARYIKQPWVVVEILKFGSKPVYLVGEFNQAGVHYMDRPLNVAQALAFGQGTTGIADLRGARIIRDNHVLPVDVYALLREGKMNQNFWLKANDTIYVPDNSENQVFVLGAVNKPGVVAMTHGRLSLMQAVATAGGLERATPDVNEVRIIRSHTATRGELLVVDLDKIRKGQALPFPLQRGDVVYIPRTPVSNWNDVITQILPTLQLIQNSLQPFVQLKTIEAYPFNPVDPL